MAVDTSKIMGYAVLAPGNNNSVVTSKVMGYAVLAPGNNNSVVTSKIMGYVVLADNPRTGGAGRPVVIVVNV